MMSPLTRYQGAWSRSHDSVYQRTPFLATKAMDNGLLASSLLEAGEAIRGGRLVWSPVGLPRTNLEGKIAGIFTLVGSPSLSFSCFQIWQLHHLTWISRDFSLSPWADPATVR